MTPEDLKMAVIKDRHNGQTVPGIPIDIKEKPQIWLFTERSVVKHSPVLNEEDHHFKEQADYHYVSEVQKGCNSLVQEGFAQKYQPKKKTLAILTEHDIEKRLQEASSTRSNHKPAAGLDGLIQTTPVKRKSSFQDKQPKNTVNTSSAGASALRNATDSELMQMSLERSMTNTDGRLAVPLAGMPSGSQVEGAVAADATEDQTMEAPPRNDGQFEELDVGTMAYENTFNQNKAQGSNNQWLYSIERMS